MVGVDLKKEIEKHKASKEVPPTQNIQIDNEQITKLCEDYPADAKNFRRWVKEKLEYYNQKPFKCRTRKIFNQRIKQDVIFINPNVKEKPKETKPKTQKVNEDLINEFKKNITVFTNKRDLAKQFYEIHPYFYDSARNWWLWSYVSCKWERVDDIDILNAIERQARVNTISSKEKNEIIEALKQEGRKNTPSPVKPTWIQFKETIVDIETGEQFRAKPCWFVTNPIPWELHPEQFEETPNIDRIFGEWVGEENKKLLYQIIAYCILPDYPLHRVFWFYGSGLNGKSKFFELLRNFIGDKNCTSTELDVLLNSRFEATYRLHKKLACQIGETNFSEMSKTSMLKKLSGGDLIGFEYKNKDAFQEKSYAKILVSTNNLPATTDKTIGFYRRCLIVDFPNQFSEKKDILSEIPMEEYKSLALKSCMVLKELLEERGFHNEGTIADKIKKYEDYSDPLGKFLSEFTIEYHDGFIWKHEFSKKLNQWCKENRHREISDVAIGKKMKERNIGQELRDANWVEKGKCNRIRAWIGLKWCDSEQVEQLEQVDAH